MLKKAIVLRGDDGVDERMRDLLERDRIAILDVDFAEHIFLPVENHARGFHLAEPPQVELRHLRIASAFNAQKRSRRRGSPPPPIRRARTRCADRTSLRGGISHIDSGVLTPTKCHDAQPNNPERKPGSDRIHPRYDSRARAGFIPLVHGAGALSPCLAITRRTKHTSAAMGISSPMSVSARFSGKFRFGCVCRNVGVGSIGSTIQ